MKIYKTERDGRYVLLDDDMRLVVPVNSFLNYLYLKNRAENTIKSYAKDLKCYFEFLNESNYLYTDFNLNVLNEFTEYLRKSNKGTTSLYAISERTPATINRILSTISSFYKYLIQFEEVENIRLVDTITMVHSNYRGMFYHTKRNPGAHRSIFKIKESAYQTHILCSKEMELLEAQLPTARDKLILHVLLQSGARISEVLAIKIEDVPIPDNDETIRVLRNIPSKGKKRHIYIPESLVEEMDEFIINHRIEAETEHDYLFVSQHPYQKNKPLTYRGIYEVFRRAANKAGIQFRFHDTRHTFITGLVESGMDFSVVKLLAGHEHISTTQKYVTLSDSFIRDTLTDYWRKKGMIRNEE